jgi:heptosyltransferase II
MNIGVILPNWVGDLTMATPTLRALRRRYPDDRIVGVARRFLAPLLEGTPWLNHVYPWEHHGRGAIGQTWRLVRRLRSERLDVLVLLRASLYAGAVGRLSGAKRVVGYAKNWRSALLTDPVPPLHHGRGSEPVSAVDDFLHLAEYLGCPVESRNLELATMPADEAAADGVWQRLGLPQGERVILLNSGGAYGAAKHWPAEHCAELARRAAVELGLTTLVLCGPGERDSAAAIERVANEALSGSAPRGAARVRSMAGEDVSFGTTKAIVRRARLLVTTDSGPRHMAAALNTPTVVLFGPIDPRWSRNYQRDSIELRLPLECSPCGRRVCPLGHQKCLRDLRPTDVLQAVGQLLERTVGREAA